MNATLYLYPVLIHDDPDGLWLSCPDIPRTYGIGDDMVMALKSLHDGLETAFSFYVEEYVPIPTPSEPCVGQQTVCLSELSSIKVSTWNAFVASGLGRTELARQLGIATQAVDTLFDFLQDSHSPHLERAWAIVEASSSGNIE
ncbi:type II toxin-antitoxin system HicB family antitoxin [Pseudomonas japonica]|uniref:type II toxin-antitoxin system HicB family antitoxin n=1 Tax=Pseudomonas japonica TaxID=256466 RepID=UPI0015E28851|nr:type II toxin-antitoxin system HicB family antitoxin [Pseudomonas japonica]MBA1245264.1 type II toxin-antitoxin system HicB family antitoxin [Pseudomonas japonica]